MAFGRRMAAFNRLATNSVLGGVAPRLPGFGVIVGLPAPVRAVLRLAGVSEFLALERELVPRAPVADERMSA